MCDFSLHHVASRPAKVGDELVTTRFSEKSCCSFCYGQINARQCCSFRSTRVRPMRSSDVPRKRGRTTSISRLSPDGICADEVDRPPAWCVGRPNAKRPHAIRVCRNEPQDCTGPCHGSAPPVRPLDAERADGAARWPSGKLVSSFRWFDGREMGQAGSGRRIADDDRLLEMEWELGDTARSGNSLLPHQARSPI